jgi:hypothetical protein
LAFAEPFDGGVNKMQKQNPISRERWGIVFSGGGQNGIKSRDIFAL